MPLMMRSVKGLSCPTWLCDVCGAPITDAHRATVLWRIIKGLIAGKDAVPLTVVHKTCDAGHVASSAPLDVVLGQMLINSGFDFKRAMRGMDTFSLILDPKRTEKAVQRALNMGARERKALGGKRWRVLERDGFRCVACGAQAGDGTTLHIDHKTPLSSGGSDEVENLQTLCAACNLSKSDREM